MLATIHLKTDTRDYIIKIPAENYRRDTFWKLVEWELNIASDIRYEPAEVVKQLMESEFSPVSVALNEKLFCMRGSTVTFTAEQE